MYCNKCGKKLSVEDRFCSFCGSPVEKETLAKKEISNSEPVETMGYGFKQTKTVEKDRFDEEWEREERREKFTFAIFGVVIVVLIIAISGGVIALLHSGSGNGMMDNSQLSAELKNELEQSQKRDELLAELENNNADISQNVLITPGGAAEVVVTPELLQPEEVENDNNEDESSNNQNTENGEDNILEDEDTEKNPEEDITAGNEQDDAWKAEYMIYDSDVRYLTTEDLNHLTAAEIRIARNEIFARHGRMFDSEDLREYFESKSWYKPTIPAVEFSNSVLNEVEKENLTFIINYEKAHSLN